jgi:hypothetical protein
MLKREMRDRYFRVAHEAHGSHRDMDRNLAAQTARNLIGFGLGEKISGGVRTGETAIVVFVRNKLPRKSLATDLAIPAEINGLTTDVVEIGGDFAALGNGGALDPSAFQPRPVPAGVSIGTAATTGSLGYPVRRPDISEPMILSNCHILADLSNPSATPDIYQPGSPQAAAQSTSRIGRFRAAVPIDFQSGSVNFMDAAVATVTPGACRASIRDIGPITGAQDPVGGETVKIYGEASRYAVGVIQYQFTSLSIAYDVGSAWFEDQLVIKRDPQSPAIARNGDSGSLVIKAPFVACGLLIAAYGTDWAIATPIERILTRFRMSLVTP